MGTQAKAKVIPFDRYTDKAIANNLTPTLTDGERYRVIGSACTQEQADRVQALFAGLARYGDCLHKAYIAQRFFPHAHLVGGEMRVISITGQSAYGFDFRPPQEGHFWLEFAPEQEGGMVEIVDFALPGVIESGNAAEDEHGRLLEGREPVVLAGIAPEWLRYRARARVWIA